MDTPRRHERPGRRSLMGSAAVHVVALLLAWLVNAIEPEQPEFLVYQVELVSPPPVEVVEEQVEPAATEELVVETPEETPPEPEPETPPPEPEPTREEVETPPPETDVETPDPESEPEERPTSGEPDPEGEVGGEDINVRMEGLRRDYPVYYENIIRQMRRCFRWRGGGELEASIQFYITRDGSVEGIEVARESGDPVFDLEAMGAVECAGGRLGPLPEDLGLDRLPVRFNFRPQGGGEAFLSFRLHGREGPVDRPARWVEPMSDSRRAGARGATTEASQQSNR